MAGVLSARGVLYAILVNSDDGLDELSLGSPATLHVVSPEGHRVERVDASELLGRRHEASSIRGGDTADNVRVVHSFLDGEPGAVFDVVCANAALALIVAGRATTLSEGFDVASKSVTEGRAAEALKRLVAVSNS
jgi:anthranilate phosphoribosyltransferase